MTKKQTAFQGNPKQYNKHKIIVGGQEGKNPLEKGVGSGPQKREAGTGKGEGEIGKGKAEAKRGSGKGKSGRGKQKVGSRKGKQEVGSGRDLKSIIMESRNWAQTLPHSQWLAPAKKKVPNSYSC